MMESRWQLPPLPNLRPRGGEATNCASLLISVLPQINSPRPLAGEGPGERGSSLPPIGRSSTHV